MAGLERLFPHIYHEKQQAGSMLCAQHSLNSLLQGNYFTAPDLSDIAHNLDQLEESYDDDNTGHSSTNMDDTGFFSVQVLDNALKVWGLNLTRWRSEVMRPYHDHPQNQLAFILHLEQHWFTLRRFGTACSNVDLDDGNGHWFNLNSFLKTPEWVGKLYLDMVLQQAEAEGYSVFAVTQADAEAPLALPRTEADVIASSLPEPNSSSTFHNPRTIVRDTSNTVQNAEAAEDHHFEDEDYELQAALQASLMATAHAAEPVPSSSMLLQPTHSPYSAGPDSGSRTPQISQPPSASSVPAFPGHTDLDPVAASVERNRVLLQRMKEQQEHAQREMWSDADLTPEEQAALQERRAQRQRQEEEEEEELRRAIAESEALAKEHRERTQPGQELPHDPSQSLANLSRTDRAFDDEDAELQAALRASLEHMPIPALGNMSSSQPMDTTDTDSAISDSTTQEESYPDLASAEVPSLNDIRRRRLARFGQ